MGVLFVSKLTTIRKLSKYGVLLILIQWSFDISAQRPGHCIKSEGERQQQKKFQNLVANKKIGFERNIGQIENEKVLYKATATQATYFFQKNEVRSTISNQNKEQVGYAMEFINANESVSLDGQGVLPTKITYHKYHKSYPNITQNRRLIYHDLWQGIDAEFYESEKSLKYDFIVRPHTMPDVIQFKMNGVKNLEILDDGTLQFETKFGKLKKGKPFSYQKIDGKKVEVESAYQLDGDIISFKLGEYDTNRTLVIDPVALLWSTFLGDGDFSFLDMYVHSATGNIYLAGEVVTANYPNTLGNVFNNGASMTDEDGFVTCLSADGTTVLWSTYITGSSVDIAKGIHVNDAGDIFLTGVTTSDDFPINGTVAAYNATRNGSYDAFVMRLNNTGSVIKYSTYVGTSVANRSDNRSIIVNGDNVYYTIYVRDNSAFLTSANAYQRTTTCDGAAVFCINTTIGGSAGLLYSTFLAPETNDEGYIEVNDMATDAAGNIYILGMGSGHFPPTTPNAVQTETQVDNIHDLSNESLLTYVAKFDPTLSNLMYGSLLTPLMINLPFSFYDCGYEPEIAVDDDGNIYFSSDWSFYDIGSPAGLTPSPNIQALNVIDPYFINPLGSAYQNVLCKIPASNPSQYEFVNVFAGNANYDFVPGVEIDNKGRLHYFYQVSSQVSSSITTTPGAIQTAQPAGDRTSSYIYSILSPTGSIEYSTLLGSDVQNGSNQTYVVPKTAFVTDDCKAYVAGNYNNHAYRYPVTPTYHDFETGTQKTVYDATPSSTGGGFVTVFHEPTSPNTIDDFASGNNTFCVGGLIYQNPNDGPINGQGESYISGNGSSPTHTLPDIGRNGSITSHPTPVTPLVQYQWEKSYDGTTWQPIFGANLDVLKPEPELNPGTVRYRRGMQGGCDTSYSNIATATISGNFNLTINAPTTPVYFCPGTLTNLDITITGASGNISWQWYDGFAPVSNSIIAPSSGSGTAASFSGSVATTAVTAGYYRLVVTDAGGCKREGFVTIMPLTAPAGSAPSITLCPGSPSPSVTLGPTAINPDFDYQWIGPSGFTSNQPNPNVTVTGDYFLRVKLKTQSSYCIAGQTQVNVPAAQPFATELTTLSDASFCQDDAPAIIGNGQTPPDGYVFQWSPGTNLDDVTLFNPTFDPGFLPLGLSPISTIEYTFTALRLSDGCIFETTMTVTDTARAFADAGIDKPACGTTPGQTFGDPTMTGSYFEWRPVSTTYPGGISALTSNGQWTMDGVNTAVSFDKFLTATFPNYTSGYTIDFEVIAAFTTYPNGCNTRDTVRLFYYPSCGGDWCTPIVAKLEGTNGACSGSTAWLEGISLAGLNSTWTTYSVDGVVQPPNIAPQGLFEDNNGVKGNQLSAGATHPSRVIVDFDDPSWGWSGANVVVYRLTSTGNFGGDNIDCSEDIQVFSAVNAGPVVGVIDNSLCNFPLPGTQVGTGNTGTYNVSGTDYTTAPNSGLIWEWGQVGSVGTPNITSGGNTAFPSFNPLRTTEFSVMVEDPVTGCIANDTMTIEMIDIVANAGINYSGVCQNSLVRLGTTEQPNHTYSWTPTAGLNDPIGVPNSTSARPYLIVPNAPSGIQYNLIVTETTTGCQARDSVIITTNTNPPPTLNNTTYSRCAGESFSIGNFISYTNRLGVTFTWTAGPGADLAWLSSTSSYRPTVTLPFTFSGTAEFTLTASKGNCGTTTATYTINDVAITINLGPNQTATCGGNLLQIGTVATSGFIYLWFPFEGLYTDAAGTTPYLGENLSQVYTLPGITTNYTLFAGTSTGCFAFDEITINPPAGLGANAGDDQTWCPNSSAISIGTSGTGTTSWSALGYTSDINGFPTTPTASQAATMMSYLSSSSSVPTNFSQTTVTPGLYVYRLTATKGGCTVTDDVVITVPDIQTDLAGVSQSVCSGESVQIGSANAPATYNYTWSAINSATENGTIDNRFVARPFVSPTVTTTYELTYAEVRTGCFVRETVVVNVTPKPNIADVSTTPVCAPIGNRNLTANIPNYNTYFNPIWYANSPNGGSVVSNPTSEPVSITTNYFLVAEDELACKDTAKITVNVENPQTPTIPSNATTDCGFKTVNLATLQGSPSTTGYTLEWHNANNTNASSLLSSLVVPAGTYYLFEKSPIGCFSNSNTVIVANNPNCSEICNNGIDDDGDGLIDCADSDCPSCNYTCADGVQLLSQKIDTKIGAGATNIPYINNLNIPAGSSRAVFILVNFEREHCQGGDDCSNANTVGVGLADNFASPTFLSGTYQITANFAGTGGNVSYQNPLNLPAGDLRFGYQNGFPTPPTPNDQATFYSRESYFIVIYENDINTILGGSPSGTIDITLPNVNAPIDGADEAIMYAFVFENVLESNVGIVRSGVSTSGSNGIASSSTSLNGNYTMTDTNLDNGQEPDEAEDGVLVLAVSGLGGSNTGGFNNITGYTKVAENILTNTTGDFTTNNEGDGFSSTVFFRQGPSSGTIDNITVQSAAPSSVQANGGMLFLFTLQSCFGAEICNNGIDDDGDGMIDCEDIECKPDQPGTIIRNN